MSDDHLLTGHRDRALSESDRRDHRKKLGRKAHGESYREQQRLKCIPPDAQINDKNEQHEKEDGFEDEHPKTAGPPLKLGFLRTSSEPFGNVAERSTLRGCEYHCRRCSTDHGCPQKNQMRRIRTDTVKLPACCKLLRRKRLPRQRRLLYVKVNSFYQSRVCGHKIAGGQSNDVS